MPEDPEYHDPLAKEFFFLFQKSLYFPFFKYLYLTIKKLVEIKKISFPRVSWPRQAAAKITKLQTWQKKQKKHGTYSINIEARIIQLIIHSIYKQYV